MGRIFLGKWWHWCVIMVTVGLLWVAGSRRMHVIEFNTFIVLLFVFVAAVVLLLLAGTRPGEQVTRDEIKPEADEENS